MRALAVGWYGHGNIGDEAFRPAIQWLVGPDVLVDFDDYVPGCVNEHYDALIFGGGSFLDQPIKSELPAGDVTIPMAFVGVGIHWVHPDNNAWLDRARLVVSRNQTDREGVLVAPDLVFARKLFQGSERFLPRERPRLLVLPNGFMVPNAGAPAWKVRASDSFELNLTETITRYRNQGWDVSIQPMLASPGPVRTPNDDRVAAMRLMTMTDTERISAGTEAISEESLCQEIERANLVISARFHGCVLATMAGVPFVGIGGHDKFRTFFEDNQLRNHLDYYGYTPEAFEQAVAWAPNLDRMQEITDLGRIRWEELQVTVAARLFS